MASKFVRSIAAVPLIITQQFPIDAFSAAATIAWRAIYVWNSDRPLKAWCWCPVSVTQTHTPTHLVLWRSKIPELYSSELCTAQNQAQQAKEQGQSSEIYAYTGIRYWYSCQRAGAKGTMSLPPEVQWWMKMRPGISQCFLFPSVL